MTLPRAPTAYAQDDQAQLRAEIERQFGRCLRTGQDALLIQGERLFQSFAYNLTAHAGGGKASALVLAARINHIGTVATTADSLLLPPALAGLTITIIHRGANAAQVFGQGTDTINGVATATGVSQSATTIASYYCPALGLWFS